MGINISSLNVGDKVAFRSDYGYEGIGPYTVTGKNGARITFVKDGPNGSVHERVLSARTGMERDYDGKYTRYVHLMTMEEMDERTIQKQKQDRFVLLWKELNSLSGVRSIQNLIRMEEIITQLKTEHYDEL